MQPKVGINARRLLSRVLLCLLSVLLLILLDARCRQSAATIPRTILEGDHAGNYQRIFGESMPADVTVVNSIVVTYPARLGVVTTDDYEFEMTVPREWIGKVAKRCYLRKSPAEGDAFIYNRRREKASLWYGPGALEGYECYCDITSVGYVHLMVRKEAEADGRVRVFVSKH